MSNTATKIKIIETLKKQLPTQTTLSELYELIRVKYNEDIWESALDQAVDLVRLQYEKNIMLFDLVGSKIEIYFKPENMEEWQEYGNWCEWFMNCDIEITDIKQWNGEDFVNEYFYGVAFADKILNLKLLEEEMKGLI